MYSVLLAMALSGAAVEPSGILFNRHAANGGCAGAQAQSAGCGGQAYSVQHFTVMSQQGGCAGAQAQSAGCNGGAGRAYLLPGRAARVEARHAGNSGGSFVVAASAPQSFSMVPQSSMFQLIESGIKDPNFKSGNGNTALLAGAKFRVGDHVSHVANAGGLFPAGTGVVTSVIAWNTGDGFSYKVRCDQTGKVLPVNFKESELTATTNQTVPPVNPGPNGTKPTSFKASRTTYQQIPMTMFASNNCPNCRRGW